jgi:hypothetical protein
MSTINKIVSNVHVNGDIYNIANVQHICINKIKFTFADNHVICLYANSDMEELLTFFTDIRLEHGVNNGLFDINKILCDKKITKIHFNDTPSFTGALYGYDTYYNKIQIYYNDETNEENIYEFYILQSSNGCFVGYFVME